LDNLTITLCISIATDVPWAIAVHSEDRARQLIGNTVLGMAGAVLAAGKFRCISPAYGLVALIVLGPAVAYLTVAAGQALERAILSRLSRSP
jgi:hypothetical protein